MNRSFLALGASTATLALTLALTFTLASPTASAEPNEPHFKLLADGAVSAHGKTYSSMNEYHRSSEFRLGGHRCGSQEPPRIAEFAPSDCSFSQTSIEGDYEPNNGETYAIQVIFHIIERTDGVTGVVSDALVQSQLDILNEDFKALAGTPGSDGTNAKIEFRLAEFDPDGNPTTGINRVVNDSFYSNPESAKAALNWDPSVYFNIYTNDANGALGYATFPMQSAGDSDDGIVLLWSSVGRNAPQGGQFNQGRTATHEAGHYFGLFHTFQSGCGTGYNAGDLIADTVPESGPQFECTEQASSCGGGNNPIHNYMDYTNDTCMNEFTPEQVNRMRCAITHYRSSLFNALPLVNFTFEPAELVYTFTDMSSDPDGTVASWQWDFGDGNTSTDQNPVHTYVDYGEFDVVLTVVDDRGVRASKTETILVNIAPIAAFDYNSNGIDVVFEDKSSDANGTIVSWEWVFGSDQTSRAQSPTHTFPAEGVYEVRLTVTDDLGTKTTITQDVDATAGGCGCQSTGSGGPLGTILVFGLALLAIRRRRVQ